MEKKYTLFLPLKKEWYDMIESGEKEEEYREIKPYWIKRLVDPSVIQDPFRAHTFKTYKTVVFTYGYTKRRMEFEIEGIKIGTGKPEWGAEPNKEYFVIKLGKRLK